MTIAWRHASLRRVFVPFIRRLASSDEESIVTSLGTTTHIPAPHVERPKVSPLTELGSKPKEEEEEKEVITFLGSGEAEPKTERRKPQDRVITWLGEKPEGIDEAYDAADTARKLRTEQAEEKTERKKRAASYPALEGLPIELIPKSVRLLRPESVNEPLDLHEALRCIIVASMHVKEQCDGVCLGGGLERLRQHCENRHLSLRRPAQG